MLKSITIGSVKIEIPVILSPMSGVTDLPFRLLVHKFGAGLVISEMIASQAVLYENKKTMKRLEHDESINPFVVQLAGCEPDVVAEAAKYNEDKGAHIIDINMGCPMKKVTNGYAGSALMRDETHAAKIIEATVKAVKIPVTVKMRTGWDSESRNAPKLAKIAEDLGAKMVTVHGRTRCQFYTGKSDWTFIKEVKDAVKIPVIANGDIKSFDDVDNVLKASQADGIMIGRGMYGRPWFLADVIHYLRTGERRDGPKIEEKKKIILEHLSSMVDHYGEETAMRLARKHLSWYSRGLVGSAEFRSQANQVTEHKKAKQLVHQFYGGMC